LLIALTYAKSANLRFCYIIQYIVSELQAVAQQQGISTQTLINLWLQEKLIHAAN
jgi:hypothetical protein